MKLLRTLLVTAVLLPCSLSALQIEGVNVPPNRVVAGTTLPLNGAGVRTVSFLLIPVKAYVAAFYAPTALRSEQAVLASPGPLRFDFIFLQGVNQSQVTQAWQAQFGASTSFTYPGFDADQKTFIGFFGPIAKGGSESVELVGTNTNVYDGGVLKGTISGRNFQKAFLSLWFGSNPVSPDLKSALLGR